MLVLTLAGCVQEVQTELGELRIVAPDVKVLGWLDVPSPLLAGTSTCPVVHCRGWDCPTDPQALACFHQELAGDVLVAEDGCITFGGPGRVVWSFFTQPCQANLYGYLPVDDQVEFLVLGPGGVTAVPADIEALAETYLDPGAVPFPADWRAPADRPLRIVAGGRFRLYPALFDQVLGVEVGFTLDEAGVKTDGLAASWDLPSRTIELLLEEGQAGEVRFSVGADDWPLREVQAVPAAAPASLEVVVAYLRDPFVGRRTPVAARAIVRDASGELVFGAPVVWTLDAGDLALDDPYVTLPGDDYVTLVDACVPPGQGDGPRRAVLRATWTEPGLRGVELTATANLAWNVPEREPDPSWAASPYCVVGEPPPVATEPVEPPPGTALPTTPAGPDPLDSSEFIAGAGGCRGCAGTGSLGSVALGLLAPGLVRRRRSPVWMRVLPVLALLACDPSHAPIDYGSVEESCFHTGGSLEIRSCCEGVLDYTPTCGGDPCTCSEDGSWSIRACECGVDACFDGEVCVVLVPS